MRETALIVGLGEVGMALLEVLAQAHDVYMEDEGKDGREWYCPLPAGEPVDVMHVCVPYSDEFIPFVHRLRVHYGPAHTVVHSTVPVGTCNKLGVTHSPVMGRHPHLVDGLLSHTKFIGGPDAGPIAEHLRRAGLRCYVTDKPETTELVKLLSTLYYAVCVEFTKEVKRQCDELGTPFELWTLWTDAYNEGVIATGHPELVRPNLIPIMQTIGGHCLMPNLDLIESVFADFVRERNR